MSRYVRDGIMMDKVDPLDTVFSDIFPDTKVAKGNSGFMKWALEGSFFNYLGTGLEGTITGVGANCLAGDTPVTTIKGRVPISDIYGHESEYQILSYNAKEEQLEYRPIIASRKIEQQDTVIVFFTKNKGNGYDWSIECTPEHRFFVRHGGKDWGKVDDWEEIDLSDFEWVEAKDLKDGDFFLRQSFELLAFDGRIQGRKKDVYDIQVAVNHNFFAETVMTHNCTIVDDPVKNAEEAYNIKVLDGIWDWYRGTFLSRSENIGDGSIDIINHTRWSTQDLCGRILDNRDMGYKWLILSIPAEHEGHLACEDILPREKYDELKSVMDKNIFLANYHQTPLDVEGRLFGTLKTYDETALAKPFEKIIAYCDTADEGSDYLACYIGGVREGEGYILDIIYTQDKMQVTEPLTARKLYENKVNTAKIESNNGGKGFARNVERLLWENHHTRQIHIDWFHQTQNKMARILTGATFVQDHVYFPKDWDIRFPELYQHITTFTKDGKNKHDDGVEALVEWGKMITGEGSINSYMEYMKKLKEGR
jgi:predicted phage terminase large subunit-like protein